MNGHWCSSESELRGTWNICAFLRCHFPDLAFLGEHSFYSFQCFGSRNQAERISFWGLHLFLHALESTQCCFPRQPVEGETCEIPSLMTKSQIILLMLSFSFLGRIIYIEKIQLLFPCGKQNQQDCYIGSVSGMSKNNTKKLSPYRNAGTTAVGKCSLKQARVFWNKVLGQPASSWSKFCH